jgi:NADH-quinone oxidoreductase subunit J
MHDTIQQVIFYVFAAITVISAVMVISQNNPVRCVLFLVLAFISSAVLWLLLNAEFLALILILVYVGAVMTLFLFVVMMLNIDIESANMEIYKKLPLGLLIVAILTALLFSVTPAKFKNSDVVESLFNIQQNAKISNTESLGMVLYTDYFLAFELAAIILLAAIIAAITLAHRKPIDSKRQNILKQLMTRSSDRVKLVDINES